MYMHSNHNAKKLIMAIPHDTVVATHVGNTHSGTHNRSMNVQVRHTLASLAMGCTDSRPA